MVLYRGSYSLDTDVLMLEAQITCALLFHSSNVFIRTVMHYLEAL